MIREYPLAWWTTVAYVTVVSVLVGALEWSAQTFYLLFYASAPIFVGLNFYEHYRRYVKPDRDD